MLILKQSTAIDIRMGPFLDVGDGFTPETGVTIAASDEAEVLKANGAATVAMTGTLAAVSGCDGWYDYTCATTDVDTVGEVVFVMQDDDVYLPIFVRGYVVEEAIYDAMFAASSAAFDANQRVDVGLWLGNAVTASSGNPDVNVESIDDIDAPATWKASINTEVDTAIETYHLDHLLAVDYDPASKPGVATALLNELVESDGGVSRFTSNALEEVWSTGLTEPSATFAWSGDVLDVMNWLGALSRNKITQTSTTQTLRDDADASDVSTSTHSDDGITHTRGEWT